MIGSDGGMMTDLLRDTSVVSSYEFERLTQQRVEGFLHSSNDTARSDSHVGSNIGQALL